MTSNEEKITTSCYTYEVTMLVQVLASSQEEADRRLDESGGYSSKRDVVLKKVVELHTETVKSENKKGKGY
jgi:hypothetical protein